jgi:UDP:flavonoid glycosyltransferase YjiC (YdhE family)
MLAKAVQDVHEVIFQYSDKYSSFLQHHNIQQFHCKHLDADIILKHSEKFSFDWIHEDNLEDVLHDQIGVIRELKPDLVIGDAAWTLKMAAEKCRVNYYALLNSYLSPYYSEVRSLPEGHLANTYRGKLPEFIFNGMLKLGEYLAYKKYHRPFAKLRKKYGLRKLKMLPEELQGDKTLLCDDPVLFPTKETDVNHVTLGPVFYRNEKDEGEYIFKENRHKSIVICMGSSGNFDKISLFNSPLFSNFNFIVAGKKLMKNFPPNFAFQEFVNLDIALSKADLLICHGGNGTLYHGLKHQKPILAFPSHFEHVWNMQQIKKLGLGDNILPGDSKEEILKKINLLTSQNFAPEMHLQINPESSFRKFRDLLC